MSKPNPSRDTRQPVLSRRAAVAGVGIVGAAAAAATLLPGVVPSPAPAAVATPAPTGGYQLTEHVQRYYQTARV